MKSPFIRSVAVITTLLVPLTCLQGCTLLIWGRGTPWPVERDGYLRIEKAVAREEGVVYLKVVMAHSEPKLWKVKYRPPTAAAERWEIDPPGEVSPEEFPAEGLMPIHLLTEEEIRESHSSGWPAGYPFSVGLSGGYYPALIFVDSRFAKNQGGLGLDTPPIAWNTGSAWVHVLATPPALVVDVIFWPLFAIVGIIIRLSQGGC